MGCNSTGTSTFCDYPFALNSALPDMFYNPIISLTQMDTTPDSTTSRGNYLEIVSYSLTDYTFRINLINNYQYQMWFLIMFIRQKLFDP
jgi:hypothetical protein